MVCDADRDLIRRDRAIAGLAVALDPQALLELLRARLPDGDWQAASNHYLRYKPGSSCLAAYQIASPGGTIDAYVKAYAEPARPKLDKAVLAATGRTGSSASPPNRLIADDLRLVVWFFPHDQRLASLGCLGHATTRCKLLRKLLPGHHSFCQGRLEALRYKPERRCVLRLTGDDDRQAAVKFYAPAEWQSAYSNARQFKSRGPLRMAWPIGRSNRHAILVSEWLPGRLLREVLASGKLPADQVEPVGAALAELHAQQPRQLDSLSREAEAGALRAVAEGIGFLLPPRARQAAQLAGQLARRLVMLEPLQRPIHGDFYAKQVLLDDSRVGIIDLDQAAWGDPARDLGNFLAHLERDVLRGLVPADHLEPVRAGLLEGYRRQSRAEPVDHVDFYRAVGLLQLAPHPFRQREPDWPRQTAQLLDRVGELVARLPALQKRPAGQRKTGRPQGNVTVLDPLQAAADPRLPLLSAAMDPRQVQLQFDAVLAPALRARVFLRAIRVIRHRPGRRAVLEYDVTIQRGPREEAATWIGKLRGKGLDRATWELCTRLYEAGFHEQSRDQIALPRPVGVIPAFHLWLQRKVSGRPASEVLAEQCSAQLAGRIAAAIDKLHRFDGRPHRMHTISDELRILEDRLARVAQQEPRLAGRLERLLAACGSLAALLPPRPPRGIHRDFYADQVLVDGETVYLLDLDLYAAGDPSLDVGNFLAHLREQALRHPDQEQALATNEQALCEAYLTLAGGERRVAVETYATLTLARHVYLSTQFPDRRPFTEKLLELCEERLGIAAQSQSLLPA